MSEIRTIKKYPNRRLYDLAISSYVTLQDVRQLILEGVELKIIDARTEEDITHVTLLQIILEQEESGPQLFSTEALQGFIRSYGDSMQSVMRQWFDHSLSLMSEAQRTNPSTATERPPYAHLSDMTQKNFALWQQMQSQWLAFMNHSLAKSDPSQTSSPASEKPSPEA